MLLKLDIGSDEGDIRHHYRTEDGIEFQDKTGHSVAVNRLRVFWVIARVIEIVNEYLRTDS
ncbi:hypothetical protein D3C71_1873490 [compost metagenome]